RGGRWTRHAFDPHERAASIETPQEAARSRSCSAKSGIKECHLSRFPGEGASYTPDIGRAPGSTRCLPPIRPRRICSKMRIAYPACPLCEAESLPLGAADCTRYPNWHEPLPTSLEWMRCGQCGHVHTRHYWSEAGLEEVFRYAHATQLAGMTENPDAKRAIWLPVVQKVLALLRPHGQSYQAFLAAGAPL